jgi:hypothetical protein
MSSTVMDSAHYYERRGVDARYTTRLWLIFTECAVMFTLVGGLAAVVAFM